MRYDHNIIVRNLIPPLGENKYVATADIREIGSAAKRSIEHGLFETWGKTKEEADRKMNEKVNKWLEENK